MLAAALITFREGLEAALIIGIVLGVLRRTRHSEWHMLVWWGTVAAVSLSLAAGVTLYTIGVKMEGRAEEIFEGTAMLLAAGFLTWMIFWMQAQGKQTQKRLEANTKHALTTGQRGGLFGLTFLAVAREGFETVLFLSAVAFTNSGVRMLTGGLIGLAAAVAAGWLLFTASVSLDVRRFFQVTGLLLMVVAAGLVAYGIHEFQEAGLIPVVVEHVWDINPVLDEHSTVGALFKSLFGYNGNPSLLEVISYLAFYGVVGTALWRQQRKLSSPHAN
ncbi:MAG TPA: high-affinity iron transporter [Anaerolineae bacterium]|nr:high-affinity iron transporter [Anaerolineae bacterium]